MFWWPNLLVGFDFCLVSRFPSNFIFDSILYFWTLISHPNTIHSVYNFTLSIFGYKFILFYVYSHWTPHWNPTGTNVFFSIRTWNSQFDPFGSWQFFKQFFCGLLFRLVNSFCVWCVYFFINSSLQTLFLWFWWIFVSLVK